MTISFISPSGKRFHIQTMGKRIHAALAAVAGIICSGIEFAAWPTFQILHIHVSSLAILCLTLLYLLCFLWEWPFSPASPQRGAAHALILSSYFWLAGLCLGCAFLLDKNAAKPWFRAAIALGCIATVVCAAAMTRMWLEDYKNYVKRLRRRRNRANEAKTGRNPITLARVDEEEFTDG